MRNTTRYLIPVFQNDQDPFDELLISAMLDDVDAVMVGKIGSVALGAPQATIDFLNIPATFGHLLLLINGRGDTVAQSTIVNVRLNNDSSALYFCERIQASAASLTPAETLAATSFPAGSLPAASAGGGLGGAILLLIPGYVTPAGAALTKGLMTLNSCPMGSSSGLTYVSASGGSWEASGANINRVTAFPAAGSFASGTFASLYGLP